MRTIAISNFKGGSGKTATAESLAAGLAMHGYKVLGVDLDMQTNFTTHAGINANNCQENIYTLFNAVKNGKQPNIDAAIVKTKCDYDMIPGSTAVFRADVDFIGVKNWQKILKDDILHPISADYDFCVIDTAPNAGVMTHAGLYATQDVIIPMELEISSCQGLALLNEFINDIKTVNKNIRIAGILPNRVKMRTNAHKLIYGQVRQYAESIGTKVYNTTISDAMAMEECHITQESIYQYAPRSKPAIDYTAFTDEYLQDYKANKH